MSIKRRLARFDQKSMYIYVRDVFMKIKENGWTFYFKTR